MNVTEKNGVLEFSGVLNEESPISTISKTVEKFILNSPKKTVKLDFSGVKRANSCGVLAWYKILEKIDGHFHYIKVPLWLVEQFNISDFLTIKCSVESILANFYCPQNDSHETVLLTIGKEIPVQANYDNFELKLTNKDGFDLEMDFEPSEYFYFISSNLDKKWGSET